MKLRDEAGTTLIGVISDTHGLLRPEAAEMLKPCGRIIHAGDIGSEAVLRALERIAPVTAVRGNVDTDAWARRLPVRECVDCGGARIYVVHDMADIDLDPAAAGINVIVFGHSHQPVARSSGGVLYLNPGSAGPRRFRLPVTAAYLTIEGTARAEIREI